MMKKLKRTLMGSIAALTIATPVLAASEPARLLKVSTEVSSFSAENTQPSALQVKIDAIKARYESKLSQLKQRSTEATADLPSKEEMIIGVDFGKMHLVEWIFDLPETTMRLQTWKLHVPEFTMGEKRWRFHVPEPCMKYMKFPWGGGMHVPDVCIKEKVWFVKVPEVAMRQQTWKLHIPEFTMKRQRWVFDLPEIKLESAKSKVDASRGKVEQISTEMQSTAAEMKQEISEVTKAYLVDAKKDGLAKFDGAIQLVSAALAAGPEASKAGLMAQLGEIKKSRDEFVAKIDEQMADL